MSPPISREREPFHNSELVPDDGSFFNVGDHNEPIKVKEFAAIANDLYISDKS